MAKSNYGKRSGKGKRRDTNTANQYFATLPTNEIGNELERRVEDYFEFCHRTGRLDLWFRAYFTYNSNYTNGGLVNSNGEYDEYQILNVNHFKNIIQHLHNNATSERIRFEPQATNTDAKSQAQTLLAQGLLEYYLREKRMERYIKAADMDALLYGEGFVSLDWDAAIGDETEDEEGEAKKEGDIVFANFTPNNLIRDYTKDGFDASDWSMTRSFVNKYDYAVRYPEYAEDIIAISPYGRSEWRDRLGEYEYQNDTDDIPLYVFYHKKTASVPEGRMIKWLQADLILTDGPLPFSDVPVYREAPDEMDETTFGSTVAWDMMPIQEALDTLYSIILTNQKTFGVQCVLTPRGSNLDASKLAEGLVQMEYTPGVDGGKPEALSLLSTPVEIFNFIDSLVHDMETISGVNSVVRGNPEASLKSGAALALVHSTSLQFAKGQAESYHNLVQDMGTATIDILKEYATTKRVAAITGKSNRQYLKEFTGEDISDIARVTVDTGNPLTGTTAGKVNLAESLLQNGLISTPEEYLMVIQTGKLEPLTEGDTSELMLVRDENEALSEGGEVLAVITDNHSLHIREHKAVLASTAARRAPEIVEAALSHIQEHMNALMDPANAQMLMMLGQEPMQAPGMGGQAGEVSGAMNPPPEQILSPTDVPGPNMPDMPALPGTDTEYNPATGEPMGMGE